MRTLQEPTPQVVGHHAEPAKYCGLFSDPPMSRGRPHSIVQFMDTRTPEKRSEIMSLVRGKNTKPELAMRRIVHRLGYRFRLHGSKLPGRPDLVFARMRKVIFVHGCFWHGHDGCAKARPPKSRKAYWNAKFKANKQRDARNIADLKTLGWSPMVVWQCEFKRTEKLTKRVNRFLSASNTRRAVRRGSR